LGENEEDVSRRGGGCGCDGEEGLGQRNQIGGVRSEEVGRTHGADGRTHGGAEKSRNISPLHTLRSRDKGRGTRGK
jgi:hypothetical protein